MKLIQSFIYYFFSYSYCETTDRRTKSSKKLPTKLQPDFISKQPLVNTPRGSNLCPSIVTFRVRWGGRKWRKSFPVWGNYFTWKTTLESQWNRRTVSSHNPIIINISRSGWERQKMIKGMFSFSHPCETFSFILRRLSLIHTSVNLPLGSAS